MIHAVAIAGLLCGLVVPRAVSSLGGLAVMAALIGVVALGGWFGWAAGLPTATDRALVLLLALPVIGALTMGVLVRAVVVGRRWPSVPDAVLTAGGAAILAVSYLRLFDLV